MNNPTRRLTLWFVLTAAFATLVSAQSSVATLTGVVLDDQQAVIAGATLTLRDAARGLSRQTVTSSGGSFAFSQIPAATWELTVEHTGFAKAK